MRIAEWEVPEKVFEAVERRMKKGPFDAAHIRGAAYETELLPRDVRDRSRWAVQEEIGTRMIAKFKRDGKIMKIERTRLWKWVSE